MREFRRRWRAGLPPLCPREPSRPATGGLGPAFLATCLAALAPTHAAADAPPLPSSRFGSVAVAGSPAPAGTEVSAWLAGSRLAATSTDLVGPDAVYRLDIPGDRAETPEIEGPVEGESFELRVGGAPVATTVWSQGGLSALDLAAASGPDLELQISDGEAVVSAEQVLQVVVSIQNDGPGSATGIDLVVQLPERAELLSASDGGVAEGTTVRWPLFALPDSDVATRDLQVRLASTFSAGVVVLELVASVSHDGATGADPDPSNDTAIDVDILDAAPDLALLLSDGRDAARPGERIVYRVLVANGGTQAATGVEISVELPSEVEFFSASHGGSQLAGRVTWPLFDLSAGSTVERVATVDVPEDLDSIVLQLETDGFVADDGANGADPVPADNSDSDIDPVLHGPDLVLEQVSVASTSIDPQSLEISGDVEVRVANRGTLPAPPFDLVLFVDQNGNGRLDPGTDTLLGSALAGGLENGAEATVPVAASGTVRFAGDRVFAMADAAGTLTELDEENNVGDSSSQCGLDPTAVPLAPYVERHWPPAGGAIYRPASKDSISTPLVVQLTDDNGDGLYDERDVPDLVFVTSDLTYLLEPQVVLRAVRGDTLAPIFDVDGVFPHPTAPSLLSLSGLAAGDIDHDGKPEILSTTFGPAAVNYVRAYEHTGALKWVSQPFHTHPSPTGRSNRDNPTLADLDGDGNTEIVVGANVFDRFGHLLWVGGGGQAFQSAGNSGERGGAIAVVADIDLDGRLEVVTGNTVYRYDGSIVWQSTLADGYPAVANFDADPFPEIVVVARGSVRLHDQDGALLWGPIELPGSDPEAGGAPTIGDFDGDGEAEIGVAGSDVYVVFDTDGSILWQASTQDHTSNLTGSTSFDFDGDGALEIVYRDERRLRIYRGADGAILFEVPISSNTWTEEPVVADVDRDGNAEIVVTSDRAPDVAIPSGERTSGLFVFADAGDGWVPARGCWNQHAYTPDQIGGDGAIPTSPAWGWLTHNSFRANLPPGGDPTASPDLTASRLALDLSTLPDLTVTARIGNGGRLPVGPGLLVAFYAGDPVTGAAPLTVVPVTQRLEAGAYVDLSATFPLPTPQPAVLTVVADDDGTGAGRERECDESNNRAAIELDSTSLGLWLTADDGTTSLGAGDETTYRIVVHNAFSGTATGVALADTMPEHTLLVAASDGGFETSGIVTWPAFDLGSNESAVRSLTVRVDSDIPLAVTSITNRTSVGYDGSQGPDPTPDNNLAVDIDQVTSVTADAGGPYAAPEGTAVLLDGSGSFDRDGSIVAYDWDLDADGQFDDASAAIVPWSFPGEGIHPVRLRVTDDSGQSDVDETTAEIGNEPPILSAPASLDGVEGTTLALEGVTASDPGDELSATVDWGDGQIETAAIVAGAVVGAHVYADDGDPIIAVCVSDGSEEVCADIPTQIANADPDVREVAGFDFDDWTAEEVGGGQSTSWSISTGGRTATESLNGAPTYLVGELPAFGKYALGLRIADPGDDDFIGLALGFEPGDSASAAADYLLLDWKRLDQDGARKGLAVSRVHGAPTSTELWLHADQAANGAANGVTELARAASLGDTGWARHTEYRFHVESTPSRLRLWVDGSLELDLPGANPAGRLALYDFSQANAVFEAIESEVSVSGYEGEAVTLRATFTDAGIADSHSGTIDWGDGSIESAPINEEAGVGDVVAVHVYQDDGTPPLSLCIIDDDGGSDCAEIPTQITNLPPRLQLQIVSTGLFEDPVEIDGTSFVDPGVLDTHDATIDWGDGTVEAATIEEANGSGLVHASHLYSSAGSWLVRLCVVDDDGGEACDSSEVPLVARALDLALTQQPDRNEIRPGEPVVFELTVVNAGTLPASGVVLTDTLPGPLLFESASGGGLFADGVVTWLVEDLAPGAIAQRTLVATAAPGTPFGTLVTNSALVGDDGASGPDAHPDDNLAIATVRFSDDVTPIVRLPEAPSGLEGTTISLGAATWEDTDGSEAHSGTVDWGDGAFEPVALVPSSGTGGSLAASHLYREDGSYAIEACVTDAASHRGCATTTAAIANAEPLVLEPGSVDLHHWIEQEYPGGDASAEWVVAADGLSVEQLINSQPSIFVSPVPAFDNVLEGVLRIAGNWDDDYVGFVLGYRPGDNTSPEADYLLIDWKRGGQGTARRGLALSRVVGIPITSELWGHLDDPANGAGNRVDELARGIVRGSSSWTYARDYRFRFEYSATRVRVWVNDLLEFDLEGAFPAGNFGFYNYSQQEVTYRGFVLGSAQRFEGQIHTLQAPFTDLGWLDTHTAFADWDDAATSALSTEFVDGFGIASGAHTYPDDGDFWVEACVEDDDGGSGCGLFPLIVVNLPPEVSAAAAAVTLAGAPSEILLASFTDPGRLDSHVAVADWGDGSGGPVAVVEDAGAGSVSGWHVWDLPGTYVVSVCVTDDDGGEGCDTLDIQVLGAPPSLRAEKTYSAIDRDGDGQVGPGDDLVYRVEIFNDGPADATDVRLVDPIPAHTTLVPGSVSPPPLITSEAPLIAEIPRVAAGASIVVQFAVTIETPLPEGIREIVNSGIVESAELAPIPTDDPSQPGIADPTRTPVTATASFVISKTAELDDLDGDGVATPGDEIAWTVTVSLGGSRTVGGITLTDPIPERTALVPDSVVSSRGELVGVDPLVLSIGTLAPGDTVQLSFRTQIDTDLPADVEEISNQAIVASDDQDALLSDDPSTPTPADPTTLPVYVHPSLSVGPAAVPEGDSGLTQLTFLLELDRPARLELSVDWTLAGISAVAGEDFLDDGGTAVFHPGEESRTVDVAILGDLVVEPDETLRLELDNPVRVVLQFAESIGSILNDDSTTLQLGDPTAEEGEALVFPVSLVAPSSLPVSVEWQTGDGSAMAGADYVAGSGSVQFAPFETTSSVEIATLADDEEEGDETVRLFFSSAVGAGLPDDEAVGTILDVGPACTLACAGPVVVPNDPGLCAAFVELPEPVATGSCGTIQCGPASGSAFPVGTTTVECVAEATATTCSIEVTVEDVDLPFVSAPDLSVGNDPGRCAAQVVYEAPVTDNCPGAAVATCLPASGEDFTVGLTAVHCTASDAAGNAGSNDGSIEVLDLEPPTIAACPADLQIEAPPGTLSWPVSFPDPEASDNCPGVTVACAPPSESAFALGTTAVVCTAADAAGASAACDFEVAVGTVPVVEIPALSPGALAFLAASLALLAIGRLVRRRAGS